MGDHKPLDLDAIEKRANAATPGPWRACREGACSCGQVWSIPLDRIISHPAFEYDFDETSTPEIYHAPNAAFIAAAREDIPALVAEVRRLRALLDAEQGEF